MLPLLLRRDTLGAIHSTSESPTLQSIHDCAEGVEGMEKPSPPPWPISILPRSLAALALRAHSLAVPPIINFARSTVLDVLKRVELGRLLVTDFNGKTTVCGRYIATEHEPTTELRILKEVFWIRVLLFADMVRLGPALAVGLLEDLR